MTNISEAIRTGLSKEIVFRAQFDMAWEHFRFHAEQRTRMFHFFLITAALILNGFALLVTGQNTPIEYREYAFLLLCIGGFLSTMFFTLDVRNTQLLGYSEDVLRSIEKDVLYNDWRQQVHVDGETKDIELGILSREEVLKNYQNKSDDFPKNRLHKWVIINNIKHKTAIRLMIFLAVLSFWVGGSVAAPTIAFGLLVIVAGLVCVIWIICALRAPDRHLSWEAKARELIDGD